MISLQGAVQCIVYLIIGGLILWLLDNVMPLFAIDNVADTGRTDAEFCRQLVLGNFACLVPLPNQANGPRSQFGVRKGDAFSLPSLGNFIAVIISLGSQKKMCGINANGIVAVMQNMLSRRYLAELQLPGCAMGQKYRSVLFVESSVTTRCLLTNPRPTIVSFPNLLPETFGKWTHKSVMARLAAKRRRGADLTSQSVENFVASRANVDVSLYAIRITIHAGTPCRCGGDGLLQQRRPIDFTEKAG